MTSPSKWVSALVLLLATFPVALTPAHARILGYLFTQGGNVLTLDTDTDTIIDQRALPNLSLSPQEEVEVFISAPDNLLMVTHGTEKSGRFRIAVFDLKSLAFKKDLGVVSSSSPWVLIPPKGPHFFVGGIDPTAAKGTGANVMMRFDRVSLNRINDLPQFPKLGDRNSFSQDGIRLYSYQSGDSSVVRILDSTDLQPLSTLDVRPFFAPNVRGKSIEDIKADRMLLAENTRRSRSDPDRFSLSTVRLTDGVRSPKISTGLEGDSQLTLMGNKIVFNETVTVLGSTGRVARIQSVGRLHVFDVSTGVKLGAITFPVHEDGKVEAIRPQGDKVYFHSSASRPGERTLASISLVTSTLLRELIVPPGDLFLFEAGP